MRRILSRCLSSSSQRLQSQVLGAANQVDGSYAFTQQQCCQAGHQQLLQSVADSRDRTWDASCSSSHDHPTIHGFQQQQASQQLSHCQPLQQQAHAPGAAQQRQQHHQQLYHHHHQQQQQQQQFWTQHHHSFQQSLQQLQPWRCYSSRVQVNPTMPPELATIITEHAAIKADRPPAPPLEPRSLAFESRRSGVIAIKAGMMQDWDEYGVRVPLTVLWIDECMVLRHKHVERDNTTSLVLSCGAKRAKQLHPRQLGEFQAAGLPLKRKLWECKVSEDALMPAGTLIGAAHFKAGQYLDITGTTKGKGFAGVMKRWNFSGQGASHGNTKHHRAPGSIGGRTDPGRVWKGKKMPGRLGGETMTFKNIWLYKVDPERNLLYVRGQVPGPQGSFVLVRDAFRWKWAERQAAELPFPTHIGDLPPVTVAKRDGADPYRVYREDIGYFEANWKGD